MFPADLELFRETGIFLRGRQKKYMVETPEIMLTQKSKIKGTTTSGKIMTAIATMTEITEKETVTM